MFNLFKKKKIEKKMEQYEFIKKSLIEFAMTEYEPDKEKRQKYINNYIRTYHIRFNSNGDPVRFIYSETPVPKIELTHIPSSGYYYSSNFEDRNYAIFTKDGKTRHASECYNYLNERYGKYK